MKTYKEALECAKEEIENNLTNPFQFICNYIGKFEDENGIDFNEYVYLFKLEKDCISDEFKGDNWTGGHSWWLYPLDVIKIIELNKLKIKFLTYLINKEDEN